jgi:hypothetical protein
MSEQFFDVTYPRKSRVSQRRAKTKTTYYSLEGGLDVVTPALSVAPGRALAMVNFEPWYQGGYRRIPGYERFDGQPKPSEAEFIGFEVDDVSSLTLGDTVTGDTSGTTGILIGIWDDDGTYGSDWIGVTKVSGTGYVAAETCNTAAFTIGNTPAPFSAPSIDIEEDWTLVAEDEYRDDIAVVPGEDAVNGVWQRLGDIFAIRNNVGSTAGILHVASAAGWVTTGIVLAEYLNFISIVASNTIQEGDTVTGLTSGASGTAHRVVLNGGSGAWDATGEGYVVLTGVTGGPFTDTEDLQVSATTVANASGVEATFAFPIDGVYRFINHNYFGGADSYRIYGVNGVGPAFEIDENKIVSPIFMPTNTIVAEDTAPPANIPFLVEEHRGHLFLGFPGGSAQHSVTGEPLNFSGFLGAGEFGLGDELTAMNSIVGNVLVLSTTRETRGLFGTSVADWELKIIAEQSGSLLFASQKIDTVYSLDDLGITSVARTDQFGDFISATVSKQVQPIVIAQRPRFNDSVVVRESNQYRLYFSDNSCLVMYVPAGASPQAQTTGSRTINSNFGFLSYDIAVKNIYNTDDETGKERTYFVTDNLTWQGYVFEDQIGKNFDGEVITSYVRTAFNQIGSPSERKKFRRMDLELNAPSQLDLRIQSDLSYSAAESSSSVDDLNNVMNIPSIDIIGGGGFWDVENWDEFLWDGQPISTARAELRGTGENIGFLIFNQTAKTNPFVLQGITLHYDKRRLQR